MCVARALFLAVAERAALLLALLVLTVAAEDAQLVGYDARARQLLVDLAQRLDVPWPKLAALERRLARSATLRIPRCVPTPTVHVRPRPRPMPTSSRHADAR